MIMEKRLENTSNRNREKRKKLDKLLSFGVL